MFLNPISILYLASTRIVLGQKDQYPYRPRSKRPVPISSSVKKASTHIVLGQKGQYPYRPRSKRPVPVWSYQYRHWSHGCSSNGILPVWARQNKGQYPYRPQSKRPVPALAAQYLHRHVAHMGTYIYILLSYALTEAVMYIINMDRDVEI